MTIRTSRLRALISDSMSDLKTVAMQQYLRQIGPSPVVSTLPDRLVIPHRWPTPNRLLTGSYAPSGKMDPDSGLNRRYNPMLPRNLTPPVTPLPAPTQTLDRALFAGPLLPAFGHFLLESLARLWAAPMDPDLPVLFTLPDNGAIRELMPWMQGVLSMLEIANPLC